MTPISAAYAIASSVLRLRSSNVSVRRSARVALPVSAPAAIEPSAPTVTGISAASKNFLPRLLVTLGPLKPMLMYAAWCGSAWSSSARVGSRTSRNWLKWNPPIVVMNLPAGTTRARLR